MKRKLTEREAWLLLARAWRAPKLCLCGCGQMIAVVCEDEWISLCAAIDALVANRRIGVRAEKDMRVRIRRELPYGGLMFPATLSGALDRVAFCVRQAKSLASKPVARRKKPRAAGKAR